MSNNVIRPSTTCSVFSLAKTVNNTQVVNGVITVENVKGFILLFSTQTTQYLEVGQTGHKESI